MYVYIYIIYKYIYTRLLNSSKLVIKPRLNLILVRLVKTFSTELINCL